VPPLGALMGAGTGLVAGVLTLLLAPGVIAVAWFWYRPLTAVIVLGLGVAAATGVGWLMRRRRAPVSAAAPG